MNQVKDRPLAVVTGASSGIGLELAREFADHGFAVVIASETPEIEAAATQLRSGGAEVTAVQVDLATADGVEELVRRARIAGDIDALAINAGVGVSGEFAQTDLEAHLNLLDLNVRGAVLLAGLVLPDMIARGEGGILFTSSIAAVMPGPYMSTYNASKSFLLSFAEALRVEANDAGVTVTALMPGPTDTNFFARADMEDTKLGQSKKDDPREVARDGFKALSAGKDHVVAGSIKNKAQVVMARAVPDKAAAAAHAPMSKPGSGK
jgi:short-subunit dehydrogenase